MWQPLTLTAYATICRIGDAIAFDVLALMSGWHPRRHHVGWQLYGASQSAERKMARNPSRVQVAHSSHGDVALDLTLACLRSRADSSGPAPDGEEERAPSRARRRLP